jgi:GNAT superfamily N-acetyltransferase
MPGEEIQTIRVDYSDPLHRDDLHRLLVEYADFETDEHPPVDAAGLKALPDLLAQFPTAFSVLAYSGPNAVGLTNCFFGFSTFICQRLVNIHDIMVTESFRGRGVAGRLLEAVEQIARENDCCRLTLEVLDDNAPAQRAYAKFGFGRTPFHPDTETLFWQKSL